MPVNPPGAPTLSGDLLTIHRMLESPTLIRRRLRTIADMRFVADRILTQRLRSAGGAVLYDVSEPIVNSRPVEAVPPGSEYPRAVTAEGVAALAAVTKWGQSTRLTDEKIKRQRMPGDELDRVLRKVVNTIVSKVDAVTLAAVASAVTATIDADTYGGAWNSTTPQILRAIEVAKAAISDLDMGYEPDTILMSSSTYAIVASDDKVASLRRRETNDNPIYGGQIETIAGLVVVEAPAARLPTNDVWILDSKQLGGMADEANVDPGYTVDEMAVQVQSKRIAEADAWDVWGRRITVPVVMEPGAAIRIVDTID
ncbi:hypothetical protein ACLQ2R_17300 [Streptosporangium sp. DT93]|uniref:phage major capsid protein n=1 Tax=Streptosporangium sp. DT93 TaxID=3393428 RepID=UPI003CF97803